MAVGRVFRVSGSLAAGVTGTITPPVNELWILSSDGIAMTSTSGSHGNSSVATDDYGPFAPSPQTQKMWLPITSTTPLTVKATGNYFFTGDITTLAAEGMSAVKRLTFEDTIADIDLYTLTAGKAAYVVLTTRGGTNTISLTTASNTVLVNLSTYYSGYAKFWLWSDMGVKIRLIGTSSTDSLVTLVEYNEDASLDEFVNRISVNQSIAAGGTYTLRPPTDEIWYVDLHTWHSNPSLQLQWNGVGTDASQAGTPRAQFRLSNDNYVVFLNNTAAPSTLLISGTKAKV